MGAPIMDIAFLTEAASLGGTVFTVVAFLWYLTKLLNTQTIRDKESIIAINKQVESNIVLAKALQRLSDIVNKNTESSVKTKISVDKNSKIVGENTDVIKKTTNGK